MSSIATTIRTFVKPTTPPPPPPRYSASSNVVTTADCSSRCTTSFGTTPNTAPHQAENSYQSPPYVEKFSNVIVLVLEYYHTESFPCGSRAMNARQVLQPAGIAIIGIIVLAMMITIVVGVPDRESPKPTPIEPHATGYDGGQSHGVVRWKPHT